MTFALLSDAEDRAEPFDDRPAPAAAEHSAEPETPRERSARAAQRISAMGEMTGGIAHDFRNILCIIASGLRLAEKSRDDPAKLPPGLAAMHEGVERGLEMTSRLLAFAKQQALEPGPEDVNMLLGRLEMFLKYGAGPGVGVSLELAPDLPKCLVDPSQFSAAILNLVVNGRDAMPAGGVIRISTAADAAADGFVRVRVSDTGHGMPPEVTRRIFDPYFTTKGEGGTGLGVPQVCALMRRVGGHVSVDSAVGAGTSFDLLFPVREDPPLAPKLWRQLDRWVNEGGATSERAARSPPAAEQ